MDGQTNGQMNRFHLYSTGFRPLWFSPEPLPCLTTTIKNFQSRTRVPMTISCLWVTGFVFWAEDPKGMMSCRIQGKSVRRSDYLSVCPSVQPFTQSPMMAGRGGRMNGRTDGQTDGQTDRRTHRFPLQDIVLFGSAAQKESSHFDLV